MSVNCLVVDCGGMPHTLFRAPDVERGDCVPKGSDVPELLVLESSCNLDSGALALSFCICLDLTASPVLS